MKGRISPPPSLSRTDRHCSHRANCEQFLLGAYFGLAALIVVVASANAVAFRDRNFGVYAVYVGIVAAGQVAYLGVGAQHVWDHWLKWNEVATFLLPGLSSAAALWFTRTVTEPARFSKALDLLVWSLIAALLSAVALDTFIVSRGSFAWSWCSRHSRWWW